MKLTALFILFSFALTAQTKIDFRDGKSMLLDGKPLGNFIIYDYLDPTVVSKNSSNYYKMDGDTLEVSVYTEWLGGRMDDLRIYRIHKNQIDLENTVFEEDLDDDGKVLSYNLFFRALDEQKFQYKKYTIYSKIGEPSDFGHFTIKSNQKEALEELAKLILDTKEN